MKKKTLFLLFILTNFFLFAQKSKIDSIPFSLDQQLLTFKGKINGKETDFAFDTGAAITVTNSKNNLLAGIEVLDSGRKIDDSSQKTIKIKKTKIKSISIANFELNAINGVTFDMPFLACNDLVLLGQDYIKQLNWKIDFKKKTIYISDRPFPTQNTMEKWKVYYKSNRPMIDFTIDEKIYKNCLLDTGFNGIMEINSDNVKTINRIFEVKKSQNKVNEFISTNMGLSGLGKPDVFNTFIVDEFLLNTTKVKNLPVTLNEITDTKLGINFFSQFSEIMILNFSEDAMCFLPSYKEIKPKMAMDARVLFIDGAITVISKNKNLDSSAGNIEVGEKVKSINGKTASQFSECDLVKWTYFTNEEYSLEKMNGEKIQIKSTSHLE